MNIALVKTEKFFDQKQKQFDAQAEEARRVLQDHNSV